MAVQMMSALYAFIHDIWETIFWKRQQTEPKEQICYCLRQNFGVGSVITKVLIYDKPAPILPELIKLATSRAEFISWYTAR